MAAGQEQLDAPAVEIRVLQDLAEFEETLRIQSEVWGFSEVDQVPSRLLGVARFIGGLVLGAYDGARMIGFSLAFPGVKPGGQAYWHSHMTAVLPAYQNSGLGQRIKLRQREEAIRAGLRLIEWTFDPLETRNAYFNIERLGVVARRYVPNFYGITSSALQGALPTDRLVAEWHVASPRVEAIVERGEKADKRVEAEVEIPAEIAAMRTRDVAGALAIQSHAREQFERHFAAGLTVVGYRRGAGGGVFELGRFRVDTNG
jgi:predicted GNAT superfamily acetyltransferase